MPAPQVAPPSQGEWWDAAAVKVAVLDELGLDDGDLDEDRVIRLIPACGHVLNDHLDYVDELTADDVGANLVEALIHLVVAAYGRQIPRFADGSFDVSGIPEVSVFVAGDKSRWGVA